ncbi:MAG: two-component regulator propeller domain-containing protein [Bacteroidota bacterium]
MLRLVPQLLGLLVLTVTAPAAAQPDEALRFAHYGVAEGLSHPSVTHVHRDGRGYVWVSTMDGLNRFDGLRFETFYADPSDSTALADNVVHGMVEDEDGMLWIGTRNGGVSRYDWRTHTFTSFQADPADPYALPHNNISALHLDAQGYLWIGTEGGACVFDRATARCHRIQFQGDDRLDTGYITALFEASDGQAWAGSISGLYRINTAPMYRSLAAGDDADTVPVSARAVSLQPPGRTGPEPSVLAVFEHGGVFWVGTDADGIYRFDPGQERAEVLPDRRLRQAHVSRFAADGSTLYFATGYNGLGIHDVETNQTRLVPYQPDRTDALSHERISHVYVDPDGILWVGTWGGGLNCLRPPSLFAHYDADDGLTNEFVWTLAEDATGAVWVGTIDGLFRFTDLGQPASIVWADEEERMVRDSEVRVVHPGRTAVWIGTQRSGIHALPNDELGEASFRFRDSFHRPNDATSLSSNLIRALHEDRRGWLWAATDSAGVCVTQDPERILADEDAPWRCLRHDPDTPGGLQSDNYRTLFEDTTGDVWLGTATAGAHRLRTSAWDGGDWSTLAIDHIGYIPGDPTTLPHPNVQSIEQDATGRYWFATFGGGLAAWDDATQQLTRYRRAEGLPNETVYGVVDDRHGHLWLPTNNGLARLTLADGFIETFTPSDGVQAREFNSGAFHRGASGRIYVGGINGFNVFDPAQIERERTVPQVRLTRILLHERPLDLGRAPALLDELVLDYKSNFLAFEYVAPAYEQAEHVAYTYQMLEDEPVQAGSSRSARYPDLAPGRYTLQVEAYDRTAPMQRSRLTLPVTIRPPWWATPWFYALSVAALLSLVVGGVRYVSVRKWKARVRALETEKRLQDERERISRDLHDHVGAQLTGLASGLDLVQRYTARNEPQKGEELIHFLRGEARQTMSQLRSTIYALQHTEVDSASFADQLRRYVGDQSRYIGETRLTFAYDGEHPHTLSPTAMLHLFRIGQEAIQNAIKHAEAKHIAVELMTAPTDLTLRVTDDGAFKPSAAGGDGLSRYGLENMRTRAEAIGATFLLDGTAMGTRIEVAWPVAALAEDAP